MAARSTLLAHVVAGLALIVNGAPAVAQPVGMIDPLYEHPCNAIIDAALAKLPKDAIRARLMAIDAPYARGVWLAEAGRSQDALEEFLRFQQSIAGIVATSHHVYTDVLIRIAIVRGQIRDYGRAIADAEEAVKTREKCLGPDNPFTLQALSVLASLLEQKGDWTSSLAVSEEILRRERRRVESLSIEERSSSRARKQVIVAEANVAALAYRLRQLDRAKAGARMTVEAVSALPVDDLERYELANSAWYVLNAYLQGALDEQRKSIEGLEQSYKAMRSRLAQEHPRTFPLLANLGFAVADIDPKQAVPMLGDYVALVEGERLRVARPSDRMTLLEGRANTYQRFAFAAHEAQRSVEAFWGIEWSKARSLRDDLSQRLALSEAVLAPEDAAALAESEHRISQLEARLETGGLESATRQADTLAVLAEKKEYEKRFAAAVARTPGLRLAAQSRIQHPNNAAEVLRPDEVFISYLTRRVDGPRLELLIAVLEPSGRLTLVGPVPAVGIESPVASFVRIVSTAGGLDAVAKNGLELWQIEDTFFLDAANKSYPEAKIMFSAEPLRHALSRQLLPASVRDIVSRYRRWVIAPAGVLWSVPFEALIDGDALVVDYRVVRYAHSWSMFTLLNETARTRKVVHSIALIAVGGASYSDRVSPSNAPNDSYPRWDDLKYSSDELNRVSQLFGLVDRQTLFKGDLALRQTVLDLNAKGTLGGARLLLLSAHGYMNVDSPARSAIVFGRPVGGTEADRYLSARDIARLKLGADVVIVSSCESGRGRKGCRWAVSMAPARRT